MSDSRSRSREGDEAWTATRVEPAARPFHVSLAASVCFVLGAVMLVIGTLVLLGLTSAAPLVVLALLLGLLIAVVLIVGGRIIEGLDRIVWELGRGTHGADRARR